MAAAAPSTPGPQTIASGDPTGAWTHPRMPEIQRRLNASTFGDKQLRIIVANVLLIAGTFVLNAALSLTWLYVWTGRYPVSRSNANVVLFRSFVKDIHEYSGAIILTVVVLSRLLAATNIALALAPLIRAPDDLSDIPLTPTQRALLGLQPATKTATPGSQYITPPRYSRTPTPRSSSRSHSGSPYSDSPRAGPAPSTNPYSPSASPLFQKAVGRDAGRRLSQGSPSGLGPANGSIFSKSPSPMHSRNSNIPFSNKWLYEKTKAGNLSFRSSIS